MSDTRAINIIIAGIIIFLIIGAFYVFLTKATIEKQKDSIKGSAGKVQVDRLIAEWANQNSQILMADNSKMSQSLTQWFKDRGYTMEHTSWQAAYCEGGNRNVQCTLNLAKKEGNTRIIYSKTIIAPTKTGIKKIIVKGEAIV